MITDVPRLGSGVPLVARRTELQTLREALNRARAGQPAVVLLSGDAGIGKSRLLTELQDAARADGDVVITGRCVDTEAALPYLPFAEAVRQLVRFDATVIDRHPALRLLLPEHQAHDDGYADAPAPSPLAQPHRSGRTDPGMGQLQLFDALRAVFGEIAGERTLVIGIEDLHWADRSSRDLFAFLASRLSTQRLLVVATYRSDDLHRRHPLRPLLAEVVRLASVDRVHLEPFCRADARTFVRSLSDEVLDDDSVARIAAASEGNAFMAEELVSASSAEVPQELAEVLLSRVERLSPATQQVMRLASVVGKQFEHERVSAASPLSDAELDEALREAIAHNVIVLEDSGDAYAFRHALLREAIYTDLLPGERSRLHRQVAKALADSDGAGVAAELAHHSMESHDLVGALAASVRAALEADELDAPAEELVHLERALRLWPSVDDPERVSGYTELDVTINAAWAAGASGEPDRAIAHSRVGIDLADRLDDQHRAVKMRRKYAEYLLTLEGTEQEAYDAARDAWRLVADGEPSAEKAWVQAILALAAKSVDRRDEVGEYASAAMATAREVPGEGSHTAAWAHALVTYAAYVDRRTLPTDQVLLRFDEAVELARKSKGWDVELRARFNYAVTLHDAGRLDEALEALDEGIERAASMGMTWSAFGLETRVLQVIGRYMAGDWDRAEAAAELVGDSVSNIVMTRISAAGLLVAVGRGCFDVVERRLAYLRDRWQVDQQVLSLVALCGAEMESWRGRPQAAVDRIEEALPRLKRLTAWHLVSISLCAVGIGGYADLAEAARRDGDAEAERRAVSGGEKLAAAASETAEYGRPMGTELGPEGRAWWRQVWAEVARLRGEHDAAAWRQTADAFGYGEPYRQAYARWRCAEALLAGGDLADRAEAAGLLREATATADRLDAAPLLDAVRGLAERARLTGGTTTVSGTKLLTPRERSVLELVADGLTNRQIGAKLYISEKTVSVHLSRVMAKLGANSRTEAVSAAYLRGQLASDRPPAD